MRVTSKRVSTIGVTHKEQNRNRASHLWVYWSTNRLLGIPFSGSHLARMQMFNAFFSHIDLVTNTPKLVLSAFFVYLLVLCSFFIIFIKDIQLVMLTIALSSIEMGTMVIVDCHIYLYLFPSQNIIE